MDNFTLTVLLGDALAILSIVALIVFDKDKPVGITVEPVKSPVKPPVKPTVKRSA